MEDLSYCNRVHDIFYLIEKIFMVLNLQNIASYFSSAKTDKSNSKIHSRAAGLK